MHSGLPQGTLPLCLKRLTHSFPEVGLSRRYLQDNVFHCGSSVCKEPTCNSVDPSSIKVQEDPLEKPMEFKRVTPQEHTCTPMMQQFPAVSFWFRVLWQLVHLTGSSDESFWECLLLVPVFQMLRFIFLCSYLESVYFTSVDLEILDLKPRRKHRKEFSAFLCMGRWENQGSLKLLPWCEIHNHFYANKENKQWMPFCVPNC